MRRCIMGLGWLMGVMSFARLRVCAGRTCCRIPVRRQRPRVRSRRRIETKAVTTSTGGCSSSSTLEKSIHLCFVVNPLLALTPRQHYVGNRDHVASTDLTDIDVQNIQELLPRERSSLIAQKRRIDQKQEEQSSKKATQQFHGSDSAFLPSSAPTTADQHLTKCQPYFLRKTPE